MKISWMDKKTNEEILAMVDESRELMNTIDKHQRGWIGHVLRGESMLREVIEGRLEGSTSRRRPRLMLLDRMMKESGDNIRYTDLKAKAMDRVSWRRWCQGSADKLRT